MADFASHKRKSMNIKEEPIEKSSADFYVVGVGASAGGLEACSELLQPLPKTTSFALVLIQHLGPHQSQLVNLLTNVCHLPIDWVTHSTAIQPGRAYVLPPQHALSISDGVLLLQDLNGGTGGGTIDHFFKSLAEDLKHRAVGVVLSGNGSDGTAGLRAIKAAGGISFAQDENTAAFSSMPRSAIMADCGDRILAPMDIAGETLQL